MTEYLYCMLILLMFLIAIYKIRLILLIRSKLSELGKKRGGLILFNKIKIIDFLFAPSDDKRKHEIKIWGYSEVELRDSDKIEEDYLYIMPLEVNFTQKFPNYLITERIFKIQEPRSKKINFN